MMEQSSARAVWSLGRVCGRLSRPAARHFSTSPVRGVRAVFAETKNGDLNEILTTIQEKIILPAYLPDKQRQMVFDPTKKTRLEQNPIVIEVEGLEHKFSTIDRFTEIPNSKAIFNKALAHMRNPEDWANLGTLLAGYKKAGVRLRSDLWAKIVRLAGESGNIHTAIECAKQADKTGLALTDRETVAYIFCYINGKIVGSGGGAAETAQALKWAEVVLDLLQRPPHVLENKPPRARLHFSPVVRGMTLFTRAAAVKAKQQAGEPVEKDLVLLRDDVDLLASLWKTLGTEDLAKVPDFAGLNPVVERQSGPKGVKVTRALNGTAYMQVLAQSIKGISLAREILGEAAQSLAPVEVALSSHLKEFVQPRKGSEGWDWEQQYEKIVGTAPDW